MTWNVLWSLLPNGFDPDNGKARLSLVASPRALPQSKGTKLGDSPLARWPSMVAAALRGAQIVDRNSGERFTATVVSPAPDQVLWDRLLPPATPVGERPGKDGAAYQQAAPAYLYGPAHERLVAMYDEVERTSPDGLLRRDHPLARTIAGLNDFFAPPAVAPDGGHANGQGVRGTGANAGPPEDQGVRGTGANAGPPEDQGVRGTGANAGPPVDQAAKARKAIPDAVADLLDPARLTPRRLDEAVRELEQQGNAAAAAMAPLAQVSARLRVNTGPVESPGPIPEPTPEGDPPPTGPLSGIPTLDRADFHQLVGLLLDHPALALRLGLRVDLEMDPFPGDPGTGRSERTVIADLRPTGLYGPVALVQPHSRVVCDPRNRRFLMAAGPDGTGEIRDGMLDLGPDPADTRYVVSDLDVVGLSDRMQAVAAKLAEPSAKGEPVALPVRRDVGLTFAQTGRHARAVAPALSAAGRFEGPGTGEVVLFADDVTGGYRVDVRTGDGRFRSLMRRQVTYTTGRAKGDAEVIQVADEGIVDPVVAVQQFDEAGDAHVMVGEEVFGWSGWAASAPLPGPKVVAEGRGTPNTEIVTPGAAPGHDLRMQVQVAPGSLPRLRYGRRYSFRARAVDLAGNSIDPELCPPELATAPVAYLRRELVPSPVLVPRREFSPGESLTRLVVRSTGDGELFKQTSERHVAPPGSSQHLAEVHGRFDAAFGPDNPARAEARRRLLAVARREAGSFQDPTVPGPDGRPVPAPGFRVTTNDPANRPPKAKLPLPPGGHLPEGEYVVLDTDAARLPFLPDAATSGASFTGLPGQTRPLRVGYGTAQWPDLEPFRLVLRAGQAAATAVTTVARRPVLEVSLPPGVTAITQVSSALSFEGAAAFGISNSKQDVLDGQSALFTPPQALTLLHATRRPVEPPVLTLDATQPQRGEDTVTVQVRGTVAAHRPTTSRVDVVASWTEITDTGSGPVLSEPREVPIESVTVPALHGPDLAVNGRQVLNDTRRRRITYTPDATTRFREYFAPVPDGDPSLRKAGQGRVVDVPNARRPAKPEVHSVVPLLRWKRTVKDDVFTSERVPAGVRVYLERTWHQTGEGERLGVIAFSSSHGGNVPGGHPARNLVSRYAFDPVGNPQSGTPVVLDHRDFKDVADARTNVQLVELPNLPPEQVGVDVIGHEVHFDPERDLWYADVDLRLFNETFTFLRLALVRFQPVSVPGCHVSEVVHTDFIQVLPERRLVVTRGEHRGDLRFELSGPALPGTSVTATSHDRFPDRLDAGLDVHLRPVFRGTAFLTPQPPDQAPLLWKGGLSVPRPVNDQTLVGGGEDSAEEEPPPLPPGPGPGPPTPIPEPTPEIIERWVQARVVVEEQQDGWSLERPNPITRPVYTEVVEPRLIWGR
ncbi:MAG TPA: hypothetical protein VKG45_02035 [Actinomycetes bacterium]|nr:hypothetical protein [Actinomycetes bacterium]